MTYLTKCHPDFHLPADVVVGEGFDAKKYVKQIKETNIDLLVFFGKCHYGFSYYPTKIGTVHPNLRTDMLGEIAKACDEEGVGIGAYYSVFLDTEAVHNHPEWALKATSKEIEGGFNSEKFLQVCVNSPYGDELLIPQSLEILENYKVDELFFDTMTGFIPCSSYQKTGWRFISFRSYIKLLLALLGRYRTSVRLYVRQVYARSERMEQ